jgi:hypothetical protein
MISTVPSPCSVCGSRTRTIGCARCSKREIALAGSEEDRHRYEAEEAERLARSNVVRLDLPHRPLPIEVALVGSGLPKNVALVGCGKAKLSTTEKVHAHELYIGNPFKMSYQYAFQAADDVHILSALHGLLSPHDRIAPYEFAMTQMFISAQREWGLRVVHALKALYPVTHLRITMLAGQQYIRPVVDALTEQDRQYWTIETPMKGLDLFQRNRWLKKKLVELEGPPF